MGYCAGFSFLMRVDMPKALQKTLLKLGISGCVALLLFNFPLLSLYRGHLFSLPTLYVVLFALWLVLILIARQIADPVSSREQRRQAALMNHD